MIIIFLCAKIEYSVETLQHNEPRRHTVKMHASAIIAWSGHDLDLWPLTLKTFWPIPTHMVNISGKFHWYSSTKYGDITSREIGVNERTTDGRTDGRHTRKT